MDPVEMEPTDSTKFEPVDAKEIQSRWVSCTGKDGPTTSRIHFIGRWSSPTSDGVYSDSKNVIVIIPGNPGLGGFYKEFMRTLYAKIDNKQALVLALSYIGHETERPSLTPKDATYNVEDQVLHKLELLDTLVPKEARVTLIGHSIGSKLVMEICKRNTTHNFADVYFLFPTVEHMAATPRGVQLAPVLRMRSILLWILALLHLITPEFLLTRLVKKSQSCSQEFAETVLTLSNPNSLNNCLSLAEDEVTTVLDLDRATIASIAHKLIIYYGMEDGWCPLEYRDNMMQVEGMSDRNCILVDVEHAFVRASSDDMGFKVGAMWRQRYVEEKCNPH